MPGHPGGQMEGLLEINLRQSFGIYCTEGKKTGHPTSLVQQASPTRRDQCWSLLPWLPWCLGVSWPLASVCTRSPWSAELARCQRSQRGRAFISRGRSQPWRSGHIIFDCLGDVQGRITFEPPKSTTSRPMRALPGKS